MYSVRFISQTSPLAVSSESHMVFERCVPVGKCTIPHSSPPFSPKAYWADPENACHSTCVEFHFQWLSSK